VERRSSTERKAKALRQGHEPLLAARFGNLIAIAMANFAAFLIGNALLGGDAIAGHAKDGHYFLSSHRRLTEVSKAVFTYRYWHTLSAYLTFPLTFVAIALIYPTKPKQDSN
jgi:hypothetical protein